MREFNFVKKADSAAFDPDRAYPIRMMFLENSMILIGFIVRETADSFHVLQPHEMMYEFDSKKRDLKAYHFVPFLRQFSVTSSIEPVIVPVYKNSVVSLVEPSSHVFRNFIEFFRVSQTVESGAEESILGNDERQGVLLN